MMVEDPAGQRVQIRMNVPVAGPPVTGTTGQTTSGDAVSVPAAAAANNFRFGSSNWIRVAGPIPG